MKYILILSILMANSAAGQLNGLWHSSFHVAGKSLLMDLEIKGIGRDGSVTVILPDQQNIKGQEMTEYALFKDSLYFRWARIGLSFAGKLANDSLTGDMKQSGLCWKVSFTKNEQIPIPSGRPQDPIGPFPYEERNWVIKNKKTKIAGTLTLPREVNFPVVVLVSGSGAQDRNCEVMGHKPFWVLADYLSKNGVAVFRYDDRGVGASTGDFSVSTEFDFSSDVLTILRYLKKEFPGHPLGIYGHSEGGMVGLMVAKSFKELSFLIESASVGTSGMDVLLKQQYDIPVASGLGEEVAQWNQRCFEQASIIALKTDQKSFLAEYSIWISSIWDELPPSLKEDKTQKEMAEEMSVFLNTDWARVFLRYRASDYLKEVNLPMLIINGEKDIQVRCDENQEGFKQNMSKESLSKSQFIVYEGLNHLLQPCKTCDIIEYASNDVSMSPLVMSDVLSWIKNQNK